MNGKQEWGTVEASNPPEQAAGGKRRQRLTFRPPEFMKWLPARDSASPKEPLSDRLQERFNTVRRALDLDTWGLVWDHLACDLDLKQLAKEARCDNSTVWRRVLRGVAMARLAVGGEQVMADALLHGSGAVEFASAKKVSGPFKFEPNAYVELPLSELPTHGRRAVRLVRVFAKADLPPQALLAAKLVSGNRYRVGLALRAPPSSAAAVRSQAA
jgi:hypothetical protein